MTPRLSPARRPEYFRERDRLVREARRLRPDAPLRVGGLCVYRGTGDLRLMQVLHIGGGVVKVGRDGRTWEEPAVYVRGARARDRGGSALATTSPALR